MPRFSLSHRIALAPLAISIAFAFIACGVGAPSFDEARYGGYEEGLTVLAQQEAQLNGRIQSLVIAPGSNERQAYMAAADEIFLMDVSDPLNIKLGPVVGEVGQPIIKIFASEKYVTAIFSEEHDLYEPEGDIAIFDREDGSSLRQTGSITGAFRSARTDGDYLYATSYETGLTIFDLTGESPTQVATIEQWDEWTTEWDPHMYSMRDAVIENGIAYVAAGETGLGIVDVSDPSSPRTITTMNLAQGAPAGYSAEVIAVEGTTLLVGGASGQILRLDVSDPTMPRVTGEAFEPQRYGGFGSLSIDGDTGYYVAWTADWVVSWRAGALNLSNPEEITISGPVLQNEIAMDNVPVADYLLIAGLGSISTLDFSGVTGPTGEAIGGMIPEAVVSRWQPWITPREMHITGNFVFAFTISGLLVLDTRSPGTIREIAQVPLNGRGPVIVEDDAAYFLHGRTAETETLARLDLSNLHNPIWLSEITVPRNDNVADTVATECPERGVGDVCYGSQTGYGNNAYALGGYSPRGAQLEFRYVFIPGSDATHGADVKTLGENIFFFDGKTLFIFDATDELRPKLIAQIAIESEPRDDRLLPRMEAEDGHVFALYNGLSVIDVSDPASPEIVATHATDAMELSVSDGTIFLMDKNGGAELLRFR